MTAPLTLLSTCGTSVLSNTADPDTRSWLNSITNRPTLEAVDQRRLDDLVAQRRLQLRAADQAAQRRISAELNGIAAVIARLQPRIVRHVLVHSDTALGRHAAEIVGECLTPPPTMLTSDGLRVDNAVAFHEALATLTRDIANWHETAGGPMWFNLTGGFKSINAYLQTLGLFFADRCAFLFENSDALVEIPRLPVKLEVQDALRSNLDVIRRMEARYTVRIEDIRGIPDILTLAFGDEVVLSAWGAAVWARQREELLGEDLLPALSTKLRVQQAVRSTFGSLEAKQRVAVNEALDALSAHLDMNQPMLKSHTFKALQGAPKRLSTHELYLWNDGGAWRLFGHFDGETFIADSIGPHLR